MSKHVGRKQRWTQAGPNRYTSDLGEVVYQERAWYALLKYQTLVPKEDASTLSGWQAHTQRLGPFKRPRNAMVALEREATLIKNRHGDGVRINDQPWAEA